MWQAVTKSWLGRAVASDELSPSSKLLIIGHSHLNALRRADLAVRRKAEATGVTDAAEANRVDFVWLQQAMFRPNIVDNSDQTKSLNEAVVKRIAFYIRRNNPSALVCCILGNEYNAIGLVRHPRPFDFYLPSDPDLPTDTSAEIIPLAMFEELLRQRLSVFRFYLEAFSKFVTIPIVSVPPPPPVPDEKHIMAHPSMFASTVGKLGVSPASLRLKIWKVFVRTQENICQELGVRFHHLPAAVFDSNGCLAKQYWNPDPTHGNAKYGRLMLDDLMSANSRG
jgi:hypothetical protein